MKITYTGRQVEFPPDEMQKLEGLFSKVAKLLDGKGDCEAHVRLSHERYLHHAEVTINYHNHALVGLASEAEPFPALHEAILKLEKQAVKVREKWRDGKRVTGPKAKLKQTAVGGTDPDVVKA
jgi:putative sigma-54 modulation protein